MNNLGIYESKNFTDITDEDSLAYFEINVLGGVRLARHYFPAMLKRNWGRVIFVSSEAAAEVHPDMIHYGVTKTGQLVVSRGLAEMTKGTRVTVNSVLPGPTRSEAIVEFLQAGLHAERHPGAGREGAFREGPPDLADPAHGRRQRSGEPGCLSRQSACRRNERRSHPGRGRHLAWDSVTVLRQPASVELGRAISDLTDSFPNQTRSNRT